jgi:hyperosmotically inducible protein
MKSEFTLGGEAGAMAGPVGRSSSAQTDARFRAGILSWSRSRGAFAGIALKGSTLRSYDEANAAIYGKPVRHEDILRGKVPTPDVASKLIATLNRYSVKEMKGNAAPPRSPFVNSFQESARVADRDRQPSAQSSGRGEARIIREVRHELVMLPYYGVFDNLSYKVQNGKVTLLGQVTRPTLKSDAEGVVKNIEGVEQVENQIEVLPLSPNDDRVRLAVYRSIYGHTALNRYALSAVPSIHIIVKNGHVTLEGTAANEGDRNIANMQANSVPGVFSVTNNLRVER